MNSTSDPRSIRSPRGWVALLSAATAGLLLLAVLATALPGLRRQVRLSIGRHDRGFTSLSFVSPGPPLLLAPGTNRDFTFKLDNETGQRQVYRVLITESSSGREVVLSTRAVPLPNRRTSLQAVTVDFPSPRAYYLLTVSVGAESITQWVATSG